MIDFTVETQAYNESEKENKKINSNTMLFCLINVGNI